MMVQTDQDIKYVLLLFSYTITHDFILSYFYIILSSHFIFSKTLCLAKRGEKDLMQSYDKQSIVQITQRQYTNAQLHNDYGPT